MADQPAIKVEMYLAADVANELQELSGETQTEVPDLIRQAVADYLALRKIDSDPNRRLILQNPETGALKQMRIK